MNNNTIIGFTLGSTKSYNSALETNSEVKKSGKSDNYDGGWIWKSQKEALKFLYSDDFSKVDWGDGNSRDPNNFSVYGVIINDWEQDTYLSNKDRQRHLLIDAKIIMLQNKG